MCVVFPLMAAGGYWRSGTDGISAAAVAGLVNGTAALAALGLLGRLRNTPWVIQGILAGMLIRMALPMAAGVTLLRVGGPLAKAGVFGMIVLYYLIGLVVETCLSVRLIQVSAAGTARVV